MDQSANVWIPGAELAGLGGVYVRGDDQVRVTSFNAAAGVTLAIEGRFLGQDGFPNVFAERHVPNTDRSAGTSTFSIGEGFLLNLMVRASGGSPRRGQCFVLLELVRGRGATLTPMMGLLQGYVTDTSRVFWPGMPAAESASGPGNIRSVTGTNPAAGAEISETVPTNARWRLMALGATLVTSAAVGNRTPTLVVDDGAAEIGGSYTNLNHTASTTIRYMFGDTGTAPTQAGGRSLGPLFGPIVLPAGARIRTVTASIDVADDWGAPTMLIEEWIED